MRKDILLVIVLAVIIVALLAILFWPKKASSPILNNNQSLADIEVFTPKPNDIVSSPLKITGIIRGNGWFGFEGQVGTITLFDDKNNILVHTYLGATTEWTTLPTNFEANLNFIPSGSATGFMVFHNENASGEPTRDKIFVLPIKFK